MSERPESIPLEPFEGEVKLVVPAHELGLDGNKPFAVIKSVRHSIRFESWLPVEDSSLFQKGDKVTVTPVTTTIGKGSETVYKITPGQDSK